MVIEKPYSKDEEFQFGKRFAHNIKPLVHFILQALKQMQIEHIVRSTHFAIQIRNIALSASTILITNKMQRRIG